MGQNSRWMLSPFILVEKLGWRVERWWAYFGTCWVWDTYKTSKWSYKIRKGVWDRNSVLESWYIDCIKIKEIKWNFPLRERIMRIAIVEVFSTTTLKFTFIKKFLVRNTKARKIRRWRQIEEIKVCLYWFNFLLLLLLKKNFPISHSYIQIFLCFYYPTVFYCKYKIQYFCYIH